MSASDCCDHTKVSHVKVIGKNEFPLSVKTQSELKPRMIVMTCLWARLLMTLLVLFINR